MATELRRYGVELRIVDKSATRTDKSRHWSCGTGTLASMHTHANPYSFWSPEVLALKFNGLLELCGSGLTIGELEGAFPGVWQQGLDLD
jgi:hypothetical protein